MPSRSYIKVMHRSAPSRVAAVVLSLTVLLILGVPSHAADPQPYEFVLKPTNDAALNAAVRTVPRSSR